MVDFSRKEEEPSIVLAYFRGFVLFVRMDVFLFLSSDIIAYAILICNILWKIFFNVFTKTRFAGNLVAAFLILLTAVVDGKPLLTWLSPMSWNSLNNIDVAGITKYPTIIYVLFMYLMIIGISIFLILFIGKKQEIIVQEER